MCAHAGIQDLAEITVYLHPLSKTTVFNLGLVLGLDYSRLKPLTESPAFLTDMLAEWLLRVDQVQKVGVPTWRRLVEALRDPRVGQSRIASKIEQDKEAGLSAHKLQVPSSGVGDIMKQLCIQLHYIFCYTRIQEKMPAKGCRGHCYLLCW